MAVENVTCATVVAALKTMPNPIPKDQHIWNALIFILFPIAIVGAYMLIDRSVGINNMNNVSAFDIIIMILATWRIVHLISFDKIFGFARSVFMNVLEDGTEAKPEKGFRRAIAELIECLWCTGVWVALSVLVLYIVTPLGRFGALILAIAALGSFMQVISRRIGAGTISHPSHPGTCA